MGNVNNNAQRFLSENGYSDLVMREDINDGVSERLYLSDIMTEFETEIKNKHFECWYCGAEIFKEGR